MADEEQLAILRQGGEAWNAWRRKSLYFHNILVADLNGADLRGVDLATADLSWSDLFEADLGMADLRGAKLFSVDFSGAALTEADLRGVNLNRGDLRGANLGGANPNNSRAGLCRRSLREASPDDDAHGSPSSKAPASCKSGVPNPSVNES